eukprot:1138884-Pelagomonas_calceolata.AAC.4
MMICLPRSTAVVSLGAGKGRTAVNVLHDIGSMVGHQKSFCMPLGLRNTTMSIKGCVMHFRGTCQIWCQNTEKAHSVGWAMVSAQDGKLCPMSVCICKHSRMHALSDSRTMCRLRHKLMDFVPQPRRKYVSVLVLTTFPWIYTTGSVHCSALIKEESI